MVMPAITAVRKHGATKSYETMQVLQQIEAALGLNKNEIKLSDAEATKA